MVMPVVCVGVDGVAAQDVVAGFADDGDSGGGDQDQYLGASVGAADAEVVQAAAVAQGEFAELVDGVVADAEASVGGVWRVGFGAGRVRLSGSGACGQGAVSALGVVDVSEFIKQVL